MRLTSYLLPALTLLTLTPLARAGSIQLIAASSFSTQLVSPNDNFWGFYSTSGGPAPRASIGAPAEDETFFPSISLTIPTGNYVTSALTRVIASPDQLTGSGVLFVEGSEPIPPPDWGSPSAPPKFGPTGSSTVSASLDDSTYNSGDNYLNPIINGSRVSTGDLNLVFDLYGFIDDTLISPGTNWAGYIGGTGQVTVPYTVELDVTYSPVPEPSSLALMATGVLALAAIARRRVLSQS